jgi:hypothetical protein
MFLPRSSALARPEFFRQPGRFLSLRWAEMTAGSVEHRIVLDLDARSIHCSCPLRPKPCFHALALAEFHAQAGDEAFGPAEAAPGWTLDLQRGQPLRRRTAEAEPQRQRRHFERLERAARGLDDLEAWLNDSLRRGLATVVSEEPAAFAGIAGRLADASLTGLSRLFRRFHESVAATTSALPWEETALAGLADVYLALRAFRRRDQLPEPLLYDLQSFLGLATRKEEVWTQGEKIADVWAVLGQLEEPLEEKLRMRRTWLWGGRSQRQALLLEYGFGDDRGFGPGLAAGTVVQATLAYYPSTWPLRVLAADDLQALPKKVEKMPGYAGFAAFADAFAGALSVQPWLAWFPAAFPAVRPFEAGGSFYLLDEAGAILALEVTEGQGWKLVALSGGRPLGLFGEWNGERLRALGATAEGRFVAVGRDQGT